MNKKEFNCCNFIKETKKSDFYNNQPREKVLEGVEFCMKVFFFRDNVCEDCWEWLYSHAKEQYENSQKQNEEKKKRIEARWAEISKK